MAWRGDRLTDAAGALALLAALLLGLSAAGTLEIVFTLQPSYALLAIAVVAGLPSALDGWRRLPRALLLSAVALVVVYLLATALGQQAKLPSQERGSDYRPFVYVFDLVLGLGVVGLFSGLWSRRFAHRLLTAAVLGAGLTSTYAVYQWIAQHYGWPLADLNTAPNSDGFTYGHSFQGTGLLGWERVRGTFKEPLVLGIFCSTMLPLAGLLLVQGRRWARIGAGFTVGTLSAALLLTVSSLSWCILTVTLIFVGLLIALRDGRVRISAALGCLAVVVTLGAPALLMNPASLAKVTGRSEGDLKLTSQNRQVAWDQATEVWATRPILGYGPGQSSVRLAYRPDPRAVQRETAPLVLGSAQGIWAASLVDAGFLGFAAWAALILGLLGFAASTAWRGRGTGLGAWLAAAAIAMLATEVTGDRIDLRAWLLLGAVTAAAGHHRSSYPHAASRESGQSSEESPQHSVRP